MTPTVIVFLVALAVGFIVLLSVFASWQSAAGRLVQLRNQVNEAVGTEAAQLQQRLDLIPNTLHVAREAVQVQMLYLKQIQIGGNHDQNPLGPPADPGAIPPELAPLTEAAANAVLRPPIDVKTYEKLQEIMASTEKDIAAARRFVQAAVAEYNTAVSTFPASIVASSRGFTPLPTRQITPELELRPVISTLPMLINNTATPPQLPNHTNHDQARN